jgi:hypothetical protein
MSSIKRSEVSSHLVALSPLHRNLSCSCCVEYIGSELHDLNGLLNNRLRYKELKFATLANCSNEIALQFRNDVE